MDDNKGDLGNDDVSFVFCKEIATLLSYFKLHIQFFTLRLMSTGFSDPIHLSMYRNNRKYIYLIKRNLNKQLSQIFHINFLYGMNRQNSICNGISIKNHR